MPVLNPAPAWMPDFGKSLTLWHGCTDLDRQAIENDREIKLSFSRPDLDFGRGFYTTTVRHQAEQWALRRFDRLSRSRVNNQAVVLIFKLHREDLARLTTLHFVLAGYHNEEYWSFVQHCRQSARARGNQPARINDHAGPILEDGKHWFDLVSGPVVGDWKQRTAFQEMDQFSFHTNRATRLINQAIQSGDPRRYTWQAVVL